MLSTKEYNEKRLVQSRAFGNVANLFFEKGLAMPLTYLFYVGD